MTTQADVRRIALSLPETEEVKGRFAFSVRNKGKLKQFVWVWMERVTPKKARVANPAVLAVRVANLGQRDVLFRTRNVGQAVACLPGADRSCLLWTKHESCAALTRKNSQPTREW